MKSEIASECGKFCAPSKNKIKYVAKRVLHSKSWCWWRQLSYAIKTHRHIRPEIFLFWRMGHFWCHNKAAKGTEHGYFICLEACCYGKDLVTSILWCPLSTNQRTACRGIWTNGSGPLCYWLTDWLRLTMLLPINLFSCQFFPEQGEIGWLSGPVQSLVNTVS